MSDISERTEDALWRMYLEHCTHMRHHETQRSTVAASLIAIAGALLSVAAFDRTLSLSDFPILVMVFVLGVFGALFSAKQYERSALHMQRARFYRNAIDHELGGTRIYDLKQDADKAHEKRFPILSGLRVNKFWLGLYMFVSIAGLSLSIIAITPSASPITPAESQHAIVEIIDNRTGEGSAPIAPPPPDHSNPLPAAESGNSPLSIPVGLLGLVAVLGLGGFLWLQRERVKAGSIKPDVANRNAGVASIVSVLTTIGAAWVAIGKVEDGWKIAMPAATAPLLTYVAARARLEPRARGWVSGLGVLGSLFFVVAHLINRAVRWQPQDWGSSLLHTLGALLARLSFADYGAMFVALLAYAVALRGAVGIEPSRSP